MEMDAVPSFYKFVKIYEYGRPEVVTTTSSENPGRNNSGRE